jgi:mRNA interferase RelE/StbE
LFRIQIKKRAFEKLEKLAPTHHDTIGNLLRVLKTDPIPYHNFDVAKLAGRSDDYRVRVGNIRVIYTIDWKEKTITISRLEFRGRAYKR